MGVFWAALGRAKYGRPDMSDGGSILVSGGSLIGTESVVLGDVLIVDGRIVEVGEGLSASAGTSVLDATGLLVFPGLVDTQVHFREPGLTGKEDLASGSLAAIAGGVTSFCEMPNTLPATTDPSALREKIERAAGCSHADHAFFLGATAQNVDRLGEWEQEPGCAGVKIFMGSSTGSLLIPDDATLERVLRSGERRVAVHAEDEARLRQRYASVGPGTEVSRHPHVRDVKAALMASIRLLTLAERTHRRVHLLHVSTAEEVALLRERDLAGLVTAEVTPNHLFLAAPECYDEYGSLAVMNPPVRERRHQEALREALHDGTFTCVGSDHAPHTAAEKARPYPDCPSGIPGVQTILPLLLLAVRDGWLTLEDIARVTSAAPAQAYGIRGKGAIAAGFDGDLALVDPTVRAPLPLEWLRSKAGFSPYAGWELAGWPVTTVLRGEIAYRDHEVVGVPRGRPLEYGDA